MEKRISVRHPQRRPSPQTRFIIFRFCHCFLILPGIEKIRANFIILTFWLNMTGRMATVEDLHDDWFADGVRRRRVGGQAGDEAENATMPFQHGWQREMSDIHLQMSAPAAAASAAPLPLDLRNVRDESKEDRWAEPWPEQRDSVDSNDESLMDRLAEPISEQEGRTHGVLLVDFRTGVTELRAVLVSGGRHITLSPADSEEKACSKQYIADLLCSVPPRYSPSNTDQILQAFRAGQCREDMVVNYIMRSAASPEDAQHGQPLLDRFLQEWPHDVVWWLSRSCRPKRTFRLRARADQLVFPAYTPDWMLQARAALLRHCQVPDVPLILRYLFEPYLRNPQPEPPSLMETDLSWLWPVMRKMGGLVAGSYAMRRFFRLPLACQDIDIYCPAAVVHHPADPLADREEHSTDSDLERFLNSRQYRQLPGQGYGPLTQIQSVRTFLVDDVKVQLIAVKEDLEVKKPDLANFIQDSFDLDVCATIFDGETVYNPFVGPECRTAHILPKYRHDCENGPFGERRYRMCHTLARLIKYQDRGFVIPERESFLALVRDQLVNWI